MIYELRTYTLKPGTVIEAAKTAGTIGRDPDVAGVVSILGVSAVNLTPNAGHLKIVLRPRAQRRERRNAAKHLALIAP